MRHATPDATRTRRMFVLSVESAQLSKAGAGATASTVSATTDTASDSFVALTGKVLTHVHYVGYPTYVRKEQEP